MRMRCDEGGRHTYITPSLLGSIFNDTTCIYPTPPDLFTFRAHQVFDRLQLAILCALLEPTQMVSNEVPSGPDTGHQTSIAMSRAYQPTST